MFSHLLRYMPTLMYKNRDGALFGIFFPFAFGLIYLMIFTGLISGGKTLETTPVAIFFQGSSQEIDFVKSNLDSIAVLGEMTADNEVLPIESHEETPLMTYITVNSLEEGRELANDSLVDAVIMIDNHDNQMKLSLEVAPSSANNFSTSVIYSALTSFSTITEGLLSSYTALAESDNPLANLNQLNQRVSEIDDFTSFTVDANQNKGTSSFSIYFYAALAYLCMFFMSIGINMVLENEAYTSPQALRASMAPIPKTKRFFASFIAWGLPSLLVVYAVVLLYYINGIPLGNHWGRILLLLTLGVIVGLLFGTAFASLFKSNINLLSVISIALPLVFGAFSGLMSAELKYMIDESIPWFSKINPVSLINDGIYYLNNYPTFTQYNQNLLILFILVCLLLVITLIGIRRSDYASL